MLAGKRTFLLLHSVSRVAEGGYETEQDLGGHQTIFEGEFALQERTRFLDLSQKNLDSTLNFDVLFEIVINYKMNPKKPQFVAFCCMQDKWRRMLKS